MGFEFAGRSYEYAVFPHERAVEIHLAMAYIRRVGKGILMELGAVTPHHAPVSHPVYDLTDKLDVCIRQDIRTIESFSGAHVLSISTIEHVGQGSYGLTAAPVTEAYELLHRVLSESESCFITMPVGERVELERMVLADQRIPKRYMTRLNVANEWAETDIPGIWTYNYPYECAGSIMVIET